jgi:hypothetical protein
MSESNGEPKRNRTDGAADAFPHSDYSREVAKPDVDLVLSDRDGGGVIKLRYRM